MTNDRGDRRIMLDTHVWVWFNEGNERKLSRRAVNTIERASQQGRVVIAAISVWEVALLESKRRIRLSMSLDAWLESALATPGLSVIPLSAGICIDAAGMAFSDPSDRLIAASARAFQAILVTRDERLLDYGLAGHLNVIDASA
jgi:PIN domain nuclease of toxin-antitoxin system